MPNRATDTTDRPLRSLVTGPFGRICAALAFTVTAAACGGDSGTTPTPPVSVSVSPSNATVGATESQALTATVANATDTGVTWTSTGGSLSGTGTSVTWTAPLEGGSYTVTATSTEDPTASGSASITVTPVGVLITAGSTALLRGEPTTLTATVSGTTASSEVTWAATCGTLTPNGTTAAYEAPTASGSCDVTATSVLDPTMSATTTLAIRAANAVTSDDDTDDGTCTWDHCSLREAMTAANTVAGADTIYLSPAAAAASPSANGAARRGTVVRGMPLAVEATESFPTIIDDVAIIGEGSQLAEIDMQDLGRAFEVDGSQGGANVTIRGLTIRNGFAAGGPAIYLRDGAVFTGNDLRLLDNEAVGVEGGAMVVVGEGTSAQLTDVFFEGNRSDFPGGAIGVVGGGSLEMMGGAFRDNRTSAWGGAVRGFNFVQLHFDGTEFDGNLVVAPGFGGGAIFAEDPDGLGGVVVLRNTSITDNGAPGGSGTGGGGGALYLRDGLSATITNSTITGNGAGPGGWGGAILLRLSDLTISGSTIVDNTAFIGGGLFVSEGNVTIDDTTIDDNEGAERGGGIWTGFTSTLDITGGSVSGNRAGDLGGAGIFAQEDPTISMTGTAMVGNAVVGNAAGGALAFFNNTQFVGMDLDIRDNVAPAAAGIYLFASASSSIQFTGLTLDNNRATGDDFAGGGIFAAGEGSLSIANSTISNNIADGRGGGIYSVTTGGFTLTDSDVRNNRAGIHGGGAYLFEGGIVERSHFQGNRADGLGGGILGQGGSIIRTSTFTDNTAVAGGGVHLGHLTTGTARPRIENSTISGNTATDGGGLSVVGTAEALHVTVTDNTATSRGGAVLTYSQDAFIGDLLVTNSIFAGNEDGAGPNNCDIVAGSGATFTSAGGNVVDDASCSFGLTSDQSSVDPLLAPELADNGGPTLTHALLEGSPAIDAGVAPDITTDQTGAARSDGSPDAGSVERGG